MKQDEIDILWQKAMQESIKDGEIYTRYRFAKLVAEAERERIKQDSAPEIEKINAYIDHAMREVQRLGQEIEQKIGCVNHDCDQCKAQPEQEPVAFASHGVINWIADKQFQHEADLYTTPPQQTWVGLNDDEIDYLIHLAYTGDEEFVQTIEAKLKEKNLPCIKPKWIGLTEKEHTDIAVECGCMSADWVFYGAAVERKLKERNT